MSRANPLISRHAVFRELGAPGWHTWASIARTITGARPTVYDIRAVRDVVDDLKAFGWVEETNRHSIRLAGNVEEPARRRIIRGDGTTLELRHGT